MFETNTLLFFSVKTYSFRFLAQYETVSLFIQSFVQSKQNELETTRNYDETSNIKGAKEHGFNANGDYT